MRVNRVVLVALAAIVIMPLNARAQVRAGGVATVRVDAHRGFIGVATEQVPARTGVSRERAVVDVVAGSPAEKAGVVKGDTILRINGAAATAAVMATPYEPGDTVTLRVRRNGRERDVRLVAGERPQGEVYARLIPADITSRIQIIQDRIHADMDTMRLQGMLSIVRSQGDSTVIIMGRDTIRTMTLRPGTNMFVFDSLVATFRHLPNDSMFRYLRSTAPAAGGVFRFDSTFRALRPTEMVAAAAVVGMRAVAGAELHDLNPELGASFGTTRGVLVLNAREGTPAERAGLRGGDVILRANGTDVSSVVELRRAIDSARPGTAVQLRVLRRGENIDITLRRE